MKNLTSLFATNTKICTRARFTQAYAIGFVTSPTSSYSLKHRIYLNG